jgi:hypothetical protein
MSAMPDCLLRLANAKPGVGCDADECLYWRPVEQLDPAVEVDPRECAIRHFRLLDGGAEIATWLMSVKQRVESGGGAPSGS